MSDTIDSAYTNKYFELNDHEKKGRPRFKDILLKNGYYIEVCNKGFKTGMKIRRENKEDMEAALIFYSKSNTVIILGEYRDGIPLNAIITRA